MRPNFLKYFLLLSLLLNVSLLGAAGYTHYRQTRHDPGPFGEGARSPAPCGSTSQAYPFEKLSLKPEQLSQLREEAVRFHEGLEEKRGEIGRLRGSLLDLMRADNPDKKAIEAAVTQISNAQEDIQNLVVAHMLEFKARLDKDQQEKFLDLIAGAMSHLKDGGCP